MENNNKPQWLIDAENEINNAANTIFGKMSDKEFRRKEITSFAASCVSKENNIKKGKSTGQKNVESGHLKSITKPWTSYEAGLAGKKGGAKNVESGWTKEFSKIGNNAKSDKLKNVRIDELKFIYSLMDNKSYTISELILLVDDKIKTRRVSRLLECEEALEFFIKEKKSHNVKFKKIWNQEN